MKDFSYWALQEGDRVSSGRRDGMGGGTMGGVWYSMMQLVIVANGGAR